MAGGLFWKKLTNKEKAQRRAARFKTVSTKLIRSPRTTFSLQKSELEKLYLHQGKSMQDISKHMRCSLHKVSYWMERYKILKRSLSEAMYVKRNPEGDPFLFQEPKTIEESKLFGMGIGLYWGEGTKANKNSVRLGNTDPELIKQFMIFLISFFGILKSDLRFELQIFSDIHPKAAMDFWTKKLRIEKHQFSRPIVTK